VDRPLLQVNAQDALMRMIRAALAVYRSPSDKAAIMAVAAEAVAPMSLFRHGPASVESAINYLPYRGQSRVRLWSRTDAATLHRLRANERWWRISACDALISRARYGSGPSA
jgi:hypothetical protein